MAEPAELPDSLPQLRRGVVAFCVLAVLRRGERYGFELVKELAALGGLLTSEATAYPLLHRLLAQGLVKSDWRQSESGRPRRYYAITPDGEAALEEFIVTWQGFRDAVDLLFKEGIRQ